MIPNFQMTNADHDLEKKKKHSRIVNKCRKVLENENPAVSTVMKNHKIPYLQTGTFKVCVGFSISQEHKVHSGVPQGSVLGPLLFITYLSDLYQGLRTRSASYADDGNIYGNPLLECAALQNDLNSIKIWTEQWKMPLNEAKRTILHIGQSNPKIAYFF